MSMDSMRALTGLARAFTGPYGVMLVETLSGDAPDITYRGLESYLLSK